MEIAFLYGLFVVKLVVVFSVALVVIVCGFTGSLIVPSVLVEVVFVGPTLDVIFVGCFVFDPKESDAPLNKTVLVTVFFGGVVAVGFVTVGAGVVLFGTVIVEFVGVVAVLVPSLNVIFPFVPPLKAHLFVLAT